MDRGVIHRSKIVNSWCLPFPGSDRSVVMRSQRYFYEKEKKRPIQMFAYIQFPSLLPLFKTVFSATVLGFLANFESGRRLLEKVLKWLTATIYNLVTLDKFLGSTQNFSLLAHFLMKALQKQT